jgi:hypothetical protein
VSIQLTLSQSLELQCRGEGDRPPHREASTTPDTAHTAKKPETSQPIDNYTIEQIEVSRFRHRGERPQIQTTHPPFGKAGFEVWVLTKGGLVSVHHCRLYRRRVPLRVHAHRVRVMFVRGPFRALGTGPLEGARVYRSS